MASIKYKTNEGYVSIPLNIIGSRVYLEDYDDGEVVPELVDDNAKLGNGIGTCSTSSGTALEVTLDNYRLVKNGIVAVTFEYDVPANATLNINNKGAKAIYNEGSAIEADVIKAGNTVMFAYDGTNYVVTSLGGGGGATQEFAVISLKTDNYTDSALTGATIVITDDNTSETILSTTWSDTDVIVGIDEGVEYTVTVGNITDYDILNTQSYTAIGGLSRQIEFLYLYDEYVDFNLPSGLKWSKKNVGATEPQLPGYYFSWGNIEGHNLNGPSTGEYSFTTEAYATTSGYGLSADIPNGSTTYDAASAIMKRGWRIPTPTEMEELYNNTDKEFITVGGVSCRKFMKKSDHNVYILCPNTGCYNGDTLSGAGLYWLSKYRDSANSYYCEINNRASVSSGTRQTGMMIRPVK